MISENQRWEFMQNSLMKVDTRSRFVGFGSSEKFEFIITYLSKDDSIKTTISSNIMNAIDKSIMDEINSMETHHSSVDCIPHAL